MGLSHFSAIDVHALLCLVWGTMRNVPLFLAPAEGWWPMATSRWPLATWEGPFGPKNGTFRPRISSKTYFVKHFFLLKVLCIFYSNRSFLFDFFT